MLDAQAFHPFQSEVALEAVVQGGGDRHRNQRSDAGEQHVFLCVPDIPLRTEKRNAQVATEYLRGAPLHDLIDDRRGKRDVEREEVPPEATQVRDSQKDLPDRVGEEQSIEEMDRPVEVVS